MNMLEKILEPKSYRTDQLESDEIDAYLGLDTGKTEAKIARDDKHQLWLHVPLQTALTPYSELFEMLKMLPFKKGETIIDLGAGYGRMGFVVGQYFKDVNFIGYEISKERVAESKKILKSRDYPNVKMIHADLASKDFVMPTAEYYFIYDYGIREAIEKTLEDLKHIAASRPIAVIGRGRASRDAIERLHPWLSQVNTPSHHPHYSIYRS